MKIYTKTGDKGETGLFGGKRVAKDDLRISAYGDVDEVNSWIGIVRSGNQESSVEVILKKIQNDLFDIGAVLATPDKKRLEGKASGFVSEEDIEALEKQIDRMEGDLQPLQTFILPGGVLLASQLHVARTVCRRAERSIVTLARQKKGSVDPIIISYVNRLSDFLFVLSRWVNLKLGGRENTWEKK